MASSLSLRGDPIIAAEQLYQERALSRRRSRWWWAIPRQVFLTLAWFSTAFVIVAQFGSGLRLFTLYEIPNTPAIQILSFLCWILLPALTLLPTTVMLHFGLQLRTLLWTSNSITREKTTGTWDLLLLSGVDARRIVRGKWLATVRRSLPAYLRLSLLRWAVIVWVIEFSRLQIDFSFLSGGRVIDFNGYYEPFSIWLVLMIGAFVLAFTLVNLLFTAAIGMFSALLTRRGLFNLILGGVIRALVLALPGILTVIVTIGMSFARVYLPYELPWRLVSSFVPTLAFTLADNGMVIPTATASVVQSYFRYGGWQYNSVWDMVALFGGLFVALFYYIAGTTVGLFWAERMAQRQEALPPLRNKRRVTQRTV